MGYGLDSVAWHVCRSGRPSCRRVLSNNVVVVSSFPACTGVRHRVTSLLAAAELKPNVPSCSVPGLPVTSAVEWPRVACGIFSIVRLRGMLGQLSVLGVPHGDSYCD